MLVFITNSCMMTRNVAVVITMLKCISTRPSMIQFILSKDKNELCPPSLEILRLSQRLKHTTNWTLFQMLHNYLQEIISPPWLLHYAPSLDIPHTAWFWTTVLNTFTRVSIRLTSLLCKAVLHKRPNVLSALATSHLRFYTGIGIQLIHYIHILIKYY